MQLQEGFPSPACHSFWAHRLGTLLGTLGAFFARYAQNTEEKREKAAGFQTAALSNHKIARLSGHRSTICARSIVRRRGRFGLVRCSTASGCRSARNFCSELEPRADRGPKRGQQAKLASVDDWTERQAPGSVATPESQCAVTLFDSFVMEPHIDLPSRLEDNLNRRLHTVAQGRSAERTIGK